MAFESSATRRRPKRFDELRGQEFVASTLKNSLSARNIAHAYLFAGPRGCGKTSAARILARALNCDEGPTPEPCGVCAHCREIARGASLDVIEIDGASNTSVDNIRQIKDEVLFPPNSSRYKIYIIDEVHMLSMNAFNALLKTIEEPPPYVVFIFATTELQKVPATIKSRCQQFNFRLVATDTIKGLLADACRELHIASDEESLFWIAKEATGSVRDAYTLFDQVAAMCSGNISFDKIKDKLGIVSLENLNALFAACAVGNAEAALNMLDEFLQQGLSVEQLASNAAHYARSLLLIKNGIEKESILGSDRKRFSDAVLSAWNKTQTERALSIFLHLYRDLRFSLAPRSELELAFSRLCSLKDFVSNGEIKTALSRAEALLLKGVQIAEVGTGEANSGSADEDASGAGARPLNADGSENGESFSNAAGSAARFPNSVESQSGIAKSANAGSADEDANVNANAESANETAKAAESSGGEKNAAFSISAEELKAKLCEVFSAEDSITASIVSSVRHWSIENGEVSLKAENEYQKNYIASHVMLLSDAVQKICGKRLKFTVSLFEKKTSDRDIPVQVELIRKIFKGSVVQ